MRLLVCGSRTYDDRLTVLDTLEGYGDELDLLIAGKAEGPDTLAAEWAKARGRAVREYPAKWKDHGKAAGPIRNQQMLDDGKPTLVLAFWNGRSPGTRDMIERAVRAGVEVRIVPAQAGRYSGGK